MTPFLDRTAKHLQLPYARLHQAVCTVLDLLQRHGAPGDLFRLRALLPEFGALLATQSQAARRRQPHSALRQRLRRWLDARETRDRIEQSSVGEFAIPLVSTFFDHLRRHLGVATADRLLASVPGLTPFAHWPRRRPEGPASGGPGQRRIA
ncbi:MAG: DUF2267 domain-containing protein [Planctomycetes bacterium]|jgi:hypothetical protein|nr:DUF2267 domain-containing protein [Planctomycetota bacterium]